MSIFKREKKQAENIPPPKFKSSFIFLGQFYYHCDRCGSVVPEERLTLHSFFHSTQDILLEKLMIALEKFKDETPEG